MANVGEIGSLKLAIGGKEDDFFAQNCYDNEYYETMPLARGEVSLWRAVVMQALIDCHTMSKRTEDQRARRDGFSWFCKKNPDFIKVCEHANMEPDYVLRRAKDAILRGCAWKKDENKAQKLSQISKNEINNLITLNPDLFKKTG